MLEFYYITKEIGIFSSSFMKTGLVFLEKSQRALRTNERTNSSDYEVQTPPPTTEPFHVIKPLQGKLLSFYSECHDT